MTAHPTTWPPDQLRPLRVEAGGWDVTCLAGGPDDGPLALLLHGFPDSPATWRHLAPVLVDRGWRVVLPWLPNHGPTRPASADAAVDPDGLARFAIDLRRRLHPAGPAVVVGHDWGSITANEVVARDPGAFDRAVTLAVAPLADRTATALSLAQVGRSSYAALLATPNGWRSLRPREWWLVERLWRRWSPGYVPQDVDRAGWVEALSHDGGRGASRYYRHLLAGLASGRWPRRGGQVPLVPSLHLAGNDDGCVGIELQRRGGELLPAHSRMVEFAGLGHFLHLEDPDAVHAEVLGWIEPIRT